MDFYEDPKVTNAAIYNNIIRKLKENKLKISNIVAYGADYASVNYGICQSVFQNLNNENNTIVKANCLCHVLHNAAKYSLMKLPFDIENFVIKI